MTCAVAGLVAITPASGSVGPMGAVAIGAASGLGCFFAATTLKRAFGYDDSLDVFGIHAVGGVIGAILTGVFAATALGGSGFGDGNETITAQVMAQFVGVVATIIYSGVVSFVILKILDAVMGLRVDEDQEVEAHDACGYDDSLDVFGIHAVGGVIGAILTGVFAATALGGSGFGDGNETITAQVMAQFVGVVATIIYSGVVSFVILKILDAIMGLRVDEDQEVEGLDLALHDERGYIS